MQSAPHSSAALQSSCFGSPSLTTHVVLIFAARRISTERAEIFSTQARSSFRSSSNTRSSGGISFPRNSGASGSSTSTTFTSLRAGHLRAATARSASSLAGEPSVPTTIRTGESGSSTRPRAIRTEQRASVNTRCDTLPKINRPNAPRPCEPTTIRSGFHSSASAISSHATEPHDEPALTCQSGKFVCTRSRARSARTSASFAASQPFRKSRCRSAGDLALRASSTIS